MVNTNESAIDRFIMAARGLIFLRHLLLFLTVYAFLWGTVVLVLWVGFGVDRTHLLWGMVGIIPALVIAGVLAQRRAPRREAVRALLDGHSHAGGLLMAADEVDLGPWKTKVPHATRPSLTWHGQNAGLLFAAAAAFVIVAFVLPRWVTLIKPHSPLHIDQEVAEIAKQIELLAEEEILEEDEAKELEEKLKAVQEEATGEDPAKTWEALDHLKDLAEKAAEQAAEDALKDGQEMSDVETITKAVMSEADKLTPEQMAEAMKELAAMAEEARKDCEGLGKELGDALEQALKNGQLTEEQLKQLAEALGKCQGNLGESLARLKNAGLIDGKLVEQYLQMTNCKPGTGKEGDGEKGLAAFLAENEDGMNMAEMLAAFAGQRPGRGGINRGRGDAPMFFGEESSEKDTKFKKQVLPAAAAADLKKSLLVGVSKGVPKDDGTESSAGGALGGAKAGGGTARTRVILPRHRSTVKRYFDRKRPAAKTPTK